MSNNQIQLFDTKSRKLQIVEGSDGKSLRNKKTPKST